MDLVEELLKAASESRNTSIEESAMAVAETAYILLWALQKVGFTREEAFKFVLETVKQGKE